MLPEELLGSYRRQLDLIEAGQMGAIREAAGIVAGSLLQGGTWHVHDTGHIIDSELIHRSGGLMCIRRLSWGFSVDNAVPDCNRKTPGATTELEVELAKVRLAVKASQVRRGDVITIGSVSGRSAGVVELAVECRRIGCRVLVVSSRAFSSALDSEHPSGMRLFECADLFVDNLAPVGDAHLTVPGIPVPLFPVSGINATVIMWLICAGVVEEMSAAGHPPEIWQSVNSKGGRERNRRIVSEIVDRRGF